MLTLVRLAAGVALLVWATHYVKSAVLALYGPDLRQIIAANVTGKARAILSGFLTAGLLQSSTACAVITGAFVAQGLMPLASALGVMLGANVSSALLAVVLSHDLSWLSPVLVLAGVAMNQGSSRMRVKLLGDTVLGLGLLTLALHLISQATAPIAHSAALAKLLELLADDLMLGIVTGAALAVVCYSSLAVIIVCASLAGAGAIPVPLGLALVLGANVGSGITALLSLLGASVPSRRVAVGNLLARSLGCFGAAMLIGPMERAAALLHSSPGTTLLWANVAFNVGLAVLASGLSGAAAKATLAILPEPRSTAALSTPDFLDSQSLGSPSVALSNAARELLRMGDRVESMLGSMLEVLRTNDMTLLESTRRLDDEIDRLCTAIKLYLSQLRKTNLSESELTRWTEIVSLAIRLEHVGDTVDGILRDAKEKKVARGLMFSDEGMAEIALMHEMLLANLKVALSHFLHRNDRDEERLARAKARFRDLEQRHIHSHLDRLTRKSVASIETSSLHLDVIGDLRRVNSLICSPWRRSQPLEPGPSAST